MDVASFMMIGLVVFVCHTINEIRFTLKYKKGHRHADQ